VAGGCQRVLAIADPYPHVVALRRPDAELDRSIIERGRTKAALPWIGLDISGHPPKVPTRGADYRVLDLTLE
jgi:hypothetical protein